MALVRCLTTKYFYYCYLCWRWPHLSSALAKPPRATGSSSWPTRAGRNRSFDIVHQTVEVERVAKSNLSESSGCRCCWWRCAGCCSDYWFQCFWCRRSWWLRFRTRPIRSMSHTFRYFPLSRFVWNYFLEHFGKQKIFSPQIHWIFTVNPLRFRFVVSSCERWKISRSLSRRRVYSRYSPPNDGDRCTEGAILLFLFNKMLILFKQSLCSSAFPDKFLQEPRCTDGTYTSCTPTATHTPRFPLISFSCSRGWIFYSMNSIWESFFLGVIFCCRSFTALYFGTHSLSQAHICAHFGTHI